MKKLFIILFIFYSINLFGQIPFLLHKSIINECVDNELIINSQIWACENLDSIRLNDGTPITKIENAASWAAATIPAYCWYDNDSTTYANLYGALYNAYAVRTGKLCPSGWHVPDTNDYNSLVSYLGGESVAGGKLKVTGLTYWDSPNTGATNRSGFTGKGGGYRYNDGAFQSLKIDGHYWLSTIYLTHWNYRLYLGYNTATTNKYEFYKTCGLSVRGIKD